MELRPALMPPELDPALIARLSKLADRLDGATAGQRDTLAEFNRLAGTDIPLADFQSIYKAEDPVDFVRRVLFQRTLAPDLSITSTELAEVVSRVMACADDHDFFLELFLVNCAHPSGIDLIYYPELVPEFPKDREPTPAEIAELALRARTEPFDESKRP